nr:Rieske 2Fe-2S domain-containing protein [Halarchaeum acidiphilum]
MTRWNDGRDEIGAVSADITEETNALPARYFTDPDVHEMEKEKVFGRYWVYAGHANRIPERGDYFTRTIGGKQIIVTRDGEGDVRAFYNVCAHRGSKMLDDAPMTDPGTSAASPVPTTSGRTNSTATSRARPRASRRPRSTPTSTTSPSADSTPRRTVSWRSRSTASARSSSSTSPTIPISRSPSRPAR